MTDKKPKLSIIINHFRTPNVLKMCLDSIKEKVKDVDYEIIIADSGTEEETITMLKQHHPDVFFIGNEDNVGFSKTVNPAIEKSRREYIFSINADIIIEEEGSVSGLMEYLDKNSDVGVVGPKLLNIDKSLQHTYFRDYNFLTVLARRTVFGNTKWGKKVLDRFIYEDKEKVMKPIDVDWLMGSAYLMKRSRLDKVGAYFDDRFFMYFEDIDLSRRFRENGYRVVYYPLVKFTHYHIRASHREGGFSDIFKNWLTRVHVVSYFKYLWKWNIERYFLKKRNK